MDAAVDQAMYGLEVARKPLHPPNRQFERPRSGGVRPKAEADFFIKQNEKAIKQEYRM